jgi:hypothetical protein
MGNRGILHDENRIIVKQWAHRNWILCQLSFKDRQRIPMSVGNYTELFFLDEATGLAAGHRPCAECQRGRYLQFKQLFLAGNAERLGKIKAKSDSQRIDALLMQDRLVGRGHYAKQRTYQADRTSLPNGTFVQHADQPCLVWSGMLHQWTESGYTIRHAQPNAPITVLTPYCTVMTLRAGYPVQVHVSAENRE